MHLFPSINYQSRCTGVFSGKFLSYRFAFNGKENDNEVKGYGNQQDYGMRIYDGRLCRFLSVDPLTKDFAFYSPFQFSGNSPIENVDLDGLEPMANRYVTEDMRKGKGSLKIQNKSTVWPTNSSSKSALNKSNITSKKQNDLSSDPMDRAGLEVSLDINLGSEFGGELVVQGYGRSETDKDYNVEVNGYGNQSTEEGELMNVSLTFSFFVDFSGDNQEDYQTKVAGTPISVEPYIKCSLGIANFEYNISTREMKAGIGPSLDSTPLIPCDFGVKEKTSILQITNDPVFESK